MRPGLAFLTAAALGLAAFAGPGAAGAAETPWQPAKGASARLVTAVDGTGTLSEIPAGLHIRLEPHWKTYWRSPGDAGLPPALDWTGSENLGAATLAYPAPHFAIADGGAAAVAAGEAGDYGFAYLNLRMGRGRSEAVQRRAGDTIAAAAKAVFSPLLDKRRVGLTFQIDVGPEVYDAKFGNLHPLFQKGKN